MWRKYSFIPISSIFLLVLAWWSVQVEHSLQQARDIQKTEPGNSFRLTQRQELMEALDRIVTDEIAFRAKNHSYTRILSRVGSTLPQALSDAYDIHVAEASSDRLLVTAMSEVVGKNYEFVTIDQDFNVHANFQIPSPRPEYLKAFAIKQLKLARGASKPNDRIDEHTVFKGYFRFLINSPEDQKKTWLAMGIRYPVIGLKFELGETGEVVASEERDFSMTQASQNPISSDITRMDEGALGQIGQISDQRPGSLAEDYSRIGSALQYESISSQDQGVTINRKISSYPSDKSLVIEPIMAHEIK